MHNTIFAINLVDNQSVSFWFLNIRISEHQEAPMAESVACSFSSYPHQQGDPFRCLTSSISLGRYMSESLDWEKWSTFTENRYMEEVKKCSRPGYVAQMKAHFEAYNKGEVAEEATTLLAQRRAVYKINADQETIQLQNQVSIGKTRGDEKTRNMISDSVEISRCTSLGDEGRAPDRAHVEAEENQLVDQVDISNCIENIEYDQAIGGCSQNIDRREHDRAQFVKFENSLTSDKVDVCVQLKSNEDDKKGAYGEDGKTQSWIIDELGGPASLDKKKLIFSPFKSRGPIGDPKPSAPPKPSVLVQNKQNRKDNSGASKNAELVENRKAPTKSLHMSVDLAPHETKKSLSSILLRLLSCRLVKALAGKEAKATQGKTLTDAVDISEHPAVSLQQKKVCSSKSTSTCRRNAQTHTVPRPFSFKSEERAAKRREFFKRLQENREAKETEKDKLHENIKVKARRDFKYKHLLPTSKVGPC